MISTKRTLDEARQIQTDLQAKIVIESLTTRPHTIAGVDISSNRFSNILYAGWIVFSYPELAELERAFVKTETTFPYVPGYLAFREVPALCEAYATLKTKPSVTMVDGHGIAHPRRLGIATHLGIELGVVTVGCAKSRLYGLATEPAQKVGSTAYLLDPKDGSKIGAYLRTKVRAKPVIVSPGHKITLANSLDIARSCVRGYRIPEPTRRAHELVNMFRRLDAVQ